MAEMRQETYARERAAFVLASWEVGVLLYFTSFTLLFGVHFFCLPIWDLGSKSDFTRRVVDAKGSSYYSSDLCHSSGLWREEEEEATLTPPSAQRLSWHSRTYGEVC